MKVPQKFTAALLMVHIFFRIVSIFVSCLLTFLTRCVPSIVFVTWCTAKVCVKSHTVGWVWQHCPIRYFWQPEWSIRLCVAWHFQGRVAYTNDVIQMENFSGSNIITFKAQCAVYVALCSSLLGFAYMV